MNNLTKSALAALAIISIPLLLAFQDMAPVSLSNSNIEDRAQHSTVFVGEAGAHGTGFVVGKDRVITARHVVEGLKADEKLTIKFADGRKAPGAILWKGEGGNDVAMLSVDTQDREALPMSCAKVRVGQSVMAFGHPKFLTNIATYGRVSGFTDYAPLLKDEADAVILDLTLAPGNSGGPVLDTQGRVVGIANAIVVALSSFGGGVASTGHAIMLPSTVICSLLNK